MSAEAWNWLVEGVHLAHEILTWNINTRWWANPIASRVGPSIIILRTVLEDLLSLCDWNVSLLVREKQWLQGSLAYRNHAFPWVVTNSSVNGICYKKLQWVYICTVLMVLRQLAYFLNSCGAIVVNCYGGIILRHFILKVNPISAILLLSVNYPLICRYR